MIQNNKVELVLNNTKIHTMKELKEYFNAEEVMSYHLKGNLLRCSFQIYQEYVSDIEKIIDKIGKGLPVMLETENVEDYIVKCCMKKAV